MCLGDPDSGEDNPLNSSVRAEHPPATADQRPAMDEELDKNTVGQTFVSAVDEEGSVMKRQTGMSAPLTVSLFITSPVLGSEVPRP